MALAPNKFLAEFPSHKNQFHRNYAAEIRGNYQESSDCFEYPPKSLLKSIYPKKILAKIFLPQKVQKQEISNLKKSFDHPCHLKSGVIFPPPPVGVGYRPRRITLSDRDLYNSSAYSKVRSNNVLLFIQNHFEFKSLHNLSHCKVPVSIHLFLGKFRIELKCLLQQIYSRIPYILK